MNKPLDIVDRIVLIMIGVILILTSLKYINSSTLIFWGGCILISFGLTRKSE